MSFASYLIQVNIYLLVYFAFYKVFLGRETFFSFNRWFLLGALLTTLLLPFLKIDWFARAAAPGPAGRFVMVLSEVTAGPSSSAGEAASSWSLFTVLSAIYWCGVVISTLILIRSLLRLYRLIRTNTGHSEGGYRHIIIPDNEEAFSFWRFLFTGRQADQQIILHEMAHIRQRHSLDVLLLEWIRIFCWFNPFVYLYKKTLTAVHEYIADDIATRQSSKYEYAALMVSRSVGIPANALIHTFFNRSLLKKRLVMLQKTKSRKAAAWKYALSLPVVAALIFLSSTTFALRTKMNSAIQQIQSVRLENIVQEAGPAQGRGQHSGAINGANSMSSLSGHVPAPGNATITVKGKITGATGNTLSGVTILEAGTGNGTVSDDHGYYSLSHVRPDAILQFRMLGYGERSIPVENRGTLNITLHQSEGNLKLVTVTALASGASKTTRPVQADTVPPPPRPSGAQKGMSAAQSQGGNKVFTWVEEMPRYPGTLNADQSRDSLMSYLHRTIRYPVVARDNGKQGIVYVQFIVEPDGSITHAKVVNAKSPGESLEQEALKVVSAMPKWIPGRQLGRPVTVQFSIPVKFVLQ